MSIKGDLIAVGIAAGVLALAAWYAKRQAGMFFQETAGALNDAWEGAKENMTNAYTYAKYAAEQATVQAANNATGYGVMQPSKASKDMQKSNGWTEQQADWITLMGMGGMGA